MTPAVERPQPISMPQIPPRYRGQCWRELQEHAEQHTAWTRELIDIEGEIAAAPLRRGLELAKRQIEVGNQLGWLKERIPMLHSKACVESWQDMRSELNERWPPLAEKRIEAAEAVEAATKALVDALSACQRVHNEQRQVLGQYRGMDRLVEGMPRVEAVIQSHGGSMDPLRRWVAGQLVNMLPQHSFDHMPSYVINPTSIAYRGKAL